AWRYPLCQGSRPGDCDPVSCGGTCESRYIRFFDRFSKTDRTSKNCHCAKEKICSIIGMHPHAGCRSYSTLSAAGQRLIRLWSLDGKDRRLRFSNDILKRFSEKERHRQLINGNSRFCCRSITFSRAPAMRLRGSAVGEVRIAAVVPVIIMFIVIR
uniref:WD_REPEATS_REGION domain-containing protein n=1 Tax=Angiostrongylus cantonensis TaxID=6313 RepID=A0A0K0CT88_ANGCA